MIQWLKKQGRLILRYIFWVFYNDPRLSWSEYWISRDFNEYLKLRKYARYHPLYDDTQPNLKTQDKLIVIAILHDYFVHLGYNGAVQTDNFGIKYLIWRYTL